jgi:hypothetical protein
VSALAWILAGLATARTFRLWAVDGITKPLRRRFSALMARLYGRNERLAKSLNEGAWCPFCIGFWIALAWVASGLAWSDTWPWQLAAGSFAVSYVAGHVTSRLEGDDIDDAD